MTDQTGMLRLVLIGSAALSAYARAPAVTEAFRTTLKDEYGVHASRAKRNES